MCYFGQKNNCHFLHVDLANVTIANEDNQQIKGHRLILMEPSISNNNFIHKNIISDNLADEYNWKKSQAWNWCRGNEGLNDGESKYKMNG